MAQVVAPNSPFAPQQHAPHGTKRSADSPLENEQRLSKRFDLLNLVDNNGTRLYIPVPGSSDAHASRRANADAIAAPHPLAATLPLSRRVRTPRPPPTDTMDVEDTPNRVYIHDLAAELSDIESDEENPIFLSDIEKHLSKIPRHVLIGPEPKSTRDNQMVLYNVPASLTVPEERDGVRKAIVEARRRIREGQVSAVTEPERVTSPSPRRMANMDIPPEDDVEAMDID